MIDKSRFFPFLSNNIAINITVKMHTIYYTVHFNFKVINQPFCNYSHNVKGFDRILHFSVILNKYFIRLILWIKVWEKLTCPPCSSASRLRGLRWLSLDLEASVRSAAQSPTARCSMRKHVPINITCGLIREKYLRQMKGVPYFPRLCKRLSNLPVAPSVAGGDEVSHAAALQEGGRGDRAICAEDLGEGNHLH